MKKTLIIFAFLFSFLILGCNDKKINEWPVTADILTDIPVFTSGQYKSSDCGANNCSIVFDDVKFFNFEDYAISLIIDGYVLDTIRIVEEDYESYEAYNYSFIYINLLYEKQAQILTIKIDTQNKRD